MLIITGMWYIKQQYTMYDGFRGRVVRVVDIESLVSHFCEFESCQGLCILLCEEAIQLAYSVSGSTHVLAHAWSNAGRGISGLPPPVKLESHNISIKLQCWCNIKPSQKKTHKKQNNIIFYISSTLKCTISFTLKTILFSIFQGFEQQSYLVHHRRREWCIYGTRFIKETEPDQQ